MSWNWTGAAPKELTDWYNYQAVLGANYYNQYTAPAREAYDAMTFETNPELFSWGPNTGGDNNPYLVKAEFAPPEMALTEEEIRTNVAMQKLFDEHPEYRQVQGPDLFTKIATGIVGGGLTLATAGLAGPVVGGLVGGAATTGLGNPDASFGDVLKGGAIGAATGGLAQYASPALSSGIQGATGASQGIANTAAGALTAGGTNAGLQYATTGSVNPIGVATSGIMGGVKGYNTAPVVNTNLYSGYLNGGLNANDLYNSTGSASLLGGDSGLSVDASFVPTFNSSYAAPSYYPTTNPGLSLMNGDSGLMVDPELAPDFKSTYDTGIQPTTQVGVDPKIKVPYDKLIKAGLAAFGGATAAGAAGTSGTAASSYAPKTFTPWDKLADFKTLGSTPSAEDTQEDNTFGLNSSFGANWYNYA